MPTRYAAACGGLAGLLVGFTIALVRDMDITDALYRIVVLTVGGAWMCGILAWLDELLLPHNNEHRPRKREEQQS